MARTHKVYSSRTNNLDANSYVGEEGRLFYSQPLNPSQGPSLRYSDGVTPGGLPLTYTGSGTSFGNIVAGNVIVSGGVYSDNYYFSNGATVITNVNGNVDLGNLSIYDQTISGDILNRDITLAPGGTGVIVMPSARFPKGNIGADTASIVYTLANGNVNTIPTYSIYSYDALNIGDYGITSGVPAPYTVYQLYATPTPSLQVGDAVTGPGIPFATTIAALGTGANANVIVTNTTINGVPTPPVNGDILQFGRATTNASLNFNSYPNVDISLSPGVGGFIVPNSSIIPETNGVFDIGSPLRRWKDIYLTSSSVYILDNDTGTDTVLTAKEGNLAVGGAAGFTVGKFTLTGNTIALTNPGEDFYIGTTGSTANLNINRTLQVLDNSGSPSFQVSRGARTTIFAPFIPAGDVGAFSIIGSGGFAYHPITSPGGMIHVTGNDGYATRLSLDNFNNGNNTSAFNAIIGRAGRGTAASPTQALNGDILLRLVGTGYRSDTGFSGVSAGGATTSLDIIATESTTNATRGTAFQIFNAPSGSNSRVQSVQFDSNVGVSIPVNGLGIRFSDLTFQNTAYSPTQVVTSVTTGAGFASPGFYQGAVTLNTTDVQNVASLSSSLTVTDTGSKNLKLQLAQNISPNSSVSFANVTVTGNLNVLGNINAYTASSLDAKILYLANSATSVNQIDGGGILLGPNLGAATRTFLYQYALGDYWDTNGAGLKTKRLYTDDIYSTANVFANGNVNIGAAVNSFDYASAPLQIFANYNTFAQVLMQNWSNGTDASSDFVATNDQGTDETYYIDMGINSSTYANAAYNIGGANDGYLYTSGGNLSVGTTESVIKFHTGGTTLANNRVVIAANGLTSLSNIRAVGNVTATYYFGNGYYLTGIVSSYGDSNVAAYLPTSSVITNINANMTAANSAITVLQGNVVSINSEINGLISNATFQENEISALRANINASNVNVASYQSFANVWLANLQANVGTLNANIAAANLAISNINSAWQANAATQETNLATLTSNAAAQQVWIGNIWNNFVATILPNALSSTVHIAATHTGNVATIITDATTANVANTIVVRDSVGAINVSAWTIHTVNTSISYSATSDDYWIGCSAKNLTITLPQTASNGRQYIVVDTVQSGAPNDTITAAGGTTVVGGSLTQQGQSKNCVFHNGVWYCN